MDPSNAYDIDVKNHVEKYQRLMQEQERSAELLIRRDRELSIANERLLALDQMKTDFISVAIHQLRTPLSAIKWTLGMLLDGDMGPINDQQRTFIMKTYESNERMIKLLGDMLLSDKVDSGKLEVSDAPISITDLIDNLLLEMRPIAEKRQIVIEFPQSGTSMAPVRLDSNRMRAVFQNLIDNAIKYSRPGGVININVKKEGSRLEISIADRGVGIPSDQQKNIFSRFFRARNAAKMETDGSGLGLFIVKNIVDRNGGVISFSSAENEGTTFRIEFHDMF